MRKCHLNTCPVGVATQDPELRKRFTGEVDHVVSFFKFLTEELREIMAELGFRTVNEMVGQVAALDLREHIDHWKYSKLDLSPVLHIERAAPSETLYNSEDQDHGLNGVLDWRLLEIASPALERRERVQETLDIKNTDRTTGAILSNAITKRYKADGLPDDTIHFKFNGTAGQSFGAFCVHGVTLELEGDANDYFGKGLSGGRLIVYPPSDAGFIPEESIIVGNVALYGATSGEVFVRGKAGERFAVRNSGVHVVVEGVGDHGCEYMTGGKVVIIGPTGRNFAAGMSGGIAYVYDVQKQFHMLCNTEIVDLDLPDLEDLDYIRRMLDRHVQYTQSTVAKFILDDFENQQSQFIKVFPRDYKRILAREGTNENVALNEQESEKVRR
jgi:glutamate synthase (NADPH/NADH) large chain